MSQKKADSKKPETKKRQAVESAFETVPSEVKNSKKKETGRKSSPKESKPAEKEKGKSSAAERGGAITPRSERMLHQAIPYILFVLTMFLSACYLFHDSTSKVGVLGGWIYDLFTGLFGWPAFLIPLVLLNLAIFWRKYVDMCLVGTKLILSTMTILFTSALVQVSVVNRAGEAIYKLGDFWKNGNQSLSGGGVLGGLLGNACWQVIGFVGSLIVLIPGILILTMFMLGITPRYVWTRARYLWQKSAEERAEQREIRREREAVRLAEEEERLAQQERERYARRMREQQEAERARREAEMAAAAAGSLYTDHSTASREAYHTESEAAPKKAKHQNEFIDLDEPQKSTKRSARNDVAEFAMDPDFGMTVRNEERAPRHTAKKINQDVVIRPAEEEPPKQAKPHRDNGNFDLAMSISEDKTAPRQPVGEKNETAYRHTAAEDLAMATVADVPSAEEDRAEDPLSGLVSVPPVRRKKPTDPRVAELENDPDFYDINSILKLQPTPEQEMMNNPEEAATELGLEVAFSPVENIRPTAEKEPEQSGSVIDTMLATVPQPAPKTEGAENKTPTAPAPVMTDASGAPIAEEEPEREYVFPPIDFLAMDTSPHDEDITEELRDNAQRLMSTLTDFNVRIKEITYSRGPTITRYELKPDAGIRVRSIANLVDDISLSLATSGVRIEAPIPDKPAVGVEVPNRNRATVYLRDLIDAEKFTAEKSRLTAALGMDVAGKPVYFDIAKMPHLLIAGATGMGKSVCINSLIVSLLYKAKPDEVRLILIDPKKVEFNIYREIPLLYTPIVIDAKRAAATLACAVAEMERRFELIERVGVRDIKGYNAAVAGDPEMEHLPHIVIIIDELAELMMVAKDQVETSICRIAQKARAAGMHLIIGTQRPSVDVITGVLKANIPSRIACTVASQVDSRTIIDIGGAEKLIGRGDMLFAPVGSAKPQRVQGAFVSEGEVESIVDFVRTNNSKVRYNRAFIENIEAEAARAEASNRRDDDEEGGGGENGDSLFENAVRVAVENNKISTSLLQRKLSIGYGRAAKLIDQMEEMGYVSEADGNKPRRILISKEMFMELVANGTLES